MFHFTSCGLPNVWLENGYREKQTAYGKAVSIEHADSLHEVIAANVADKRGRLTGKEFRFLRNMLGLSRPGWPK